MWSVSPAWEGGNLGRGGDWGVWMGLFVPCGLAVFIKGHFGAQRCADTEHIYGGKQVTKFSHDNSHVRENELCYL